MYLNFLLKSSPIIKSSSSTLLKNFVLIRAKQNEKFKFIKVLNRSVSSSVSPLNSEKSKSKNEEIESEKLNKILTVPNVLTTTRILLTPVISNLIFINQTELAFKLFILAGLTDLLDGYIARNYKNQLSYLGSILDPLADKLLIGTMTITLGMCNLMPFELMLIIIIRDLLLAVSAIYIKFSNNSSDTKFHIKPNFLSKINTFVQLLLITVSIPAKVYSYHESVYLIILQYICGATTISSGISYLFKSGYTRVLVKK